MPYLCVPDNAPGFLAHKDPWNKTYAELGTAGSNATALRPGKEVSTLLLGITVCIVGKLLSGATHTLDRDKTVQLILLHNGTVADAADATGAAEDLLSKARSTKQMVLLVGSSLEADERILVANCGLPKVKYHWLEACVQQNKVMEFSEYQT